MIELAKYPGYALTDDFKIWSHKSGRVLNPSPMPEGYIALTLNRKGTYLHRVIAEVYLGECPEGKEVNHIDI